MDVLLLIGGLALLLVGGETLVRGAVGVAARVGLSPMLIGITLVGFGTSTPELVTSLNAAFAGSPGIAIGNVVGSNIANILLIIGVTSVIAPIACDPAILRRDGGAMAAAAAACVAGLLLGGFGLATGVVFVSALVGYMAFAVLFERRRTGASGPDVVGVGQPRGSLPINAALAMGGIALVILGAQWLVNASIAIAAAVGIRESVIGLTIVAVGTSLPELATSVIAARRGHAEIAFGNVVGSNIYNVLGILGVTAMIRPVAAPPQIAAIDGWVMLGVTALLLVLAATQRRIVRWEGALLLVLYAGYIGSLAVRAPTA